MYFDFFQRVGLQVEGSSTSFFSRVFAKNRCAQVDHAWRRRITIAEDGRIAPTGIFLSRTSSFHEESLYLADDQGRWLVSSFDRTKTRLAVYHQPEFDALKLSKVMEWGLHILAAQEGLAFIHSMGYGTRNGAVICSAWLNTGKTKTLVLLLAAGHSYVGDDWTAVDRQGQVWAYAKVPFIYPRDVREISSIVRPYLGRNEQFLLGLDAMLGSGEIGRWLVRVAMRVLGVSFPMMPAVCQLARSIVKPRTSLYRFVYLARGDNRDFSLEPMSDGEWLPRIMQVYRYEHGLLLSPHVFTYAFPDSGTLADHYRSVQGIVSDLDWSNARLLRIPWRARAVDVQAFLRQAGLCD